MGGREIRQSSFVRCTRPGTNNRKDRTVVFATKYHFGFTASRPCRTFFGKQSAWVFTLCVSSWPFLQRETPSDKYLIFALFRKKNILCDSRYCSQNYQQEVTRNIVRQVWNKWLNQYVSVRFWSHLWLIDGFSVYYEFKLTDTARWKPITRFDHRKRDHHRLNLTDEIALENGRPARFDNPPIDSIRRPTEFSPPINS